MPGDIVVSLSALEGIVDYDRQSTGIALAWQPRADTDASPDGPDHLASVALGRGTAGEVPAPLEAEGLDEQQAPASSPSSPGFSGVGACLLSSGRGMALGNNKATL